MVNRSMNSHFQSLSLLGLVFCNSIHLEVASDSFCFLLSSVEMSSQELFFIMELYYRLMMVFFHVSSLSFQGLFS